MSNLVTSLEHTQKPTGAICAASNTATSAIPKMREYLEKIAPMNNIEKIKKPMFVIVGKNDPRAPVTESQQIADALKMKRRDFLPHLSVPMASC